MLPMYQKRAYAKISVLIQIARINELTNMRIQLRQRNELVIIDACIENGTHQTLELRFR